MYVLIGLANYVTLMELTEGLNIWENLDTVTLKSNKKMLLKCYYNKLLEADINKAQRCTFMSLYTGFDLTRDVKSYLLLKLPIQVTLTIAQLRMSKNFILH